MTLEHFDIRLFDDDRVIVVDTHPEKVEAIGEALRQLGSTPMSHSTWTCRPDVTIDNLVLAVGELAQDECIYLIARGDKRLDLQVVAAPRIRAGIVVGE